MEVQNDLKLEFNSFRVLQNRYLLKNKHEEIIETPSQLFRRVAHTVAQIDKRYDFNPQKLEEKFYRVMTNFEFLPNSPTLMNAGTTIGQLAACFVIPVEDSIEGIFDAIKYMTIIQKSGGGTGFSFSRLRPKGDVVKTTKGIASGPVSFMRAFDIATEVIKQGGRRRGANMGILSVEHPDILEFISAKSSKNLLNNFNLSVAVSDKFMQLVKKNKKYFLINPRTKEKVTSLKARQVFDLIVKMAWQTGDPGIIFIDEINRHNPTPAQDKIEATNPCGEQPLLPYESCVLGSINLSKMVTENKKINWQKLQETVHLAVHFLDNVIDANHYPLKQIKNMTLANRKIGLGVMGWAECLIKMDIPYNSNKALQMTEKIAKFIQQEAVVKSQELGKVRGSFPNFKKSIWAKKGYKKLRNATLTTIAPTGSISIIASCSSGIEPLFGIAYVRTVMEGTKLIEINNLFEKVAKTNNFYSKELISQIAQTGSIQKIAGIPEHIKRIFVTAFDIAPEWHVKMQAAFQKYVDNAVSKTVNLPHTATIKDVENIFLLAYKLKCKGITVYRYGSKKKQVLQVGKKLTRTTKKLTVDSDFSGGCPDTYCSF